MKHLISAARDDSWVSVFAFEKYGSGWAWTRISKTHEQDQSRSRHQHYCTIFSLQKHSNQNVQTSITTVFFNIILVTFPLQIYHTFHDEVRLYQQHWWRCDGPCQKRPPFFGMVRRASNRAPGKNDFWWANHQSSCGGTFIKIKEPENYKSKKKKTEPDNTKSKKPPNPDISKWFKPTNSKPSTNPQINAKPKSKTTSGTTSKPTQSKPEITSGVKKLGNTTNSVHGFGTGGPGSSSGSPGTSSSSGTAYSSSGTLGGSRSGRSILLDKFPVKSSTPKKKSGSTMDKFLNNKTPNGFSAGPSQTETKKVACPICGRVLAESEINAHLDTCLSGIPGFSGRETDFETIEIDSSVEDKPRDVGNDVIDIDDFSECPICGKLFKLEQINGHVDSCLEKPSTSRKRKSSVVEIEDDKKTSSQDKHRCLICNQEIDNNYQSLNEHLEDCIGEMFNDNSIDEEFIKKKTEKSVEPEKNKFPCPVCMTVVEEAQMNQHLDTCLQ